MAFGYAMKRRGLTLLQPRASEGRRKTWPWLLKEWPLFLNMATALVFAVYGQHLLDDLSQPVFFEVANHFAMRLPELYCGFLRVSGQAPTPYPVACLPQAWSSGTVFMLLQASLGVHIDGQRNRNHVERPLLPLGIEHLSVRALPINDARVDLHFHRIGEEVVVVPAGHVDCGVRVLAHL
jgi:hypothetical protein